MKHVEGEDKHGDTDSTSFNRDYIESRWTELKPETLPGPDSD